MIITYEGADYTFDIEDVTVKQAIKIEKFTGLSFAEWGQQLEKGGNLEALQAVGWLVLHGGRDVAIEDTDFKMMKFGEAFAKAATAEAAAEATAEAADPTSAAAANGGTSQATQMSAAAVPLPSRPSSGPASP